MSCEQTLPRGDSDANFVVGDPPRIKGIAPATGLIVLIVHLFLGDKL